MILQILLNQCFVPFVLQQTLEYLLAPLLNYLTTIIGTFIQTNDLFQRLDLILEQLSLVRLLLTLDRLDVLPIFQIGLMVFK